MMTLESVKNNCKANNPIFFILNVQRPKHRDQTHPYAGESSGIRIGVQKGIRLKA